LLHGNQSTARFPLRQQLHVLFACLLLLLLPLLLLLLLSLLVCC
jgi:hypothetical protein